MAKPKQTYAQSGVDYSTLDPIKVLAQQQAKGTAGNLKSFSMQELSASRGESAYVWESEQAYHALVVEGLGTKNLVADAMRETTGKTYYDQIAQDTVAMIVNDLIVVGALPQVVNAYFAVGDSNWLADKERAADLINGWAAACELAGAVWGGGETPTLKGIIEPATIDLGGSSIGIIQDKKNLVLGDKLAAGDKIILVASSGIHSNGITMARSLAAAAPEGYQTKLSDGRMFGEALLTPTPIYVPLVRELQKDGVVPHYMANITGHGWRKIMRASKELTYVITEVPTLPAEFEFIAEQSGASETEMYGNFNMGAGFAIYAAEADMTKALKAIERAGFVAWEAGVVKDGPKQVVIEPKNITFSEDSLEVR